MPEAPRRSCMNRGLEGLGAARPRILLVERSAPLRLDLEQSLLRAGYAVEASEAAPLRTPEPHARPFDLLLLGVDARGVVEGLEAGRLEGSKILLGGDGTPIPSASTDWLRKPFSVAELESRIVARLARDAEAWPLDPDPLLRTENPVWRQQLARVRRWAERSIPISLVGEMGTGRLALARRIHGWSPRAGRAFVVVDSAELECDGSRGMRSRFLEARKHAESGTLVWIDPSEASRETQSMVLGWLRDAGPSEPRWLTIGSASLDENVALGRLDRELQYRLEPARVFVPPLRDRAEDQLAICRAVAERLARELGVTAPPIDQTLVDQLAEGGFVGNRLGLENRLRAALMGVGGDPQRSGNWLSRGIVAGMGATGMRAPQGAPSLNLKTLERQTIVRALEHWDGNRTRASESLGISVRTLRNKIREYALR